MPQRMRFFSGQLLTAKDFETEQMYQIEMRRLHNRSLHGAGIVDGLRVSAEDSQSGAAVVVSPGLALDGLGREIVVDCPARLNVGVCGTEACFVTLQYTETATDPVPTADGGGEYSRVTESFLVAISTEDPGKAGGAQVLGLARLIQREARWMIDDSYCPMRRQ